MTATAIDKGAPGRDDEYGFGIVNPVAALTADVPPLGSDPPSGKRSRAAGQPPSDNNNDLLLAGVLVGTLIAAAAVVGGVVAYLYAKR